MSEPMDLAFRLLKRQTELGEHPGFEDEAFSSHGPVTHYHATKLPENAESISRHGIWPMGNYATHSGGKTKAVYSDLVDNMKLENKEPLIWATGEGQKLPIEYAGTYDDKWVGEPQFDESGMLIPGTGPSHEKEFQEGGMFGIRGSDIDWERSPSPIYRQGEEFYIHNQPIPREQIIPMPVQTGEPMDIAMRLLKDFYFGGASPQNMESGVFRPTWLPEGAVENKNLDPNLIQNQPDYFGANLSQQTQEEDPSQRRSAYQDEEGNWLSDEEIAQKLMGTLGHEGLHVAQDPALREAYGMGEDPLESEQFGDFMPAHEYGVISTTSPDMTEAALNYYAHPQLNYNPNKEQAAAQRYKQLAVSNLPANITQGVRSQMNALQQMGMPQQQIQQGMQQGMMPQQMYQNMMPQQQMVQTGEPMDIAFRLLKDRKSPEAFANKKKYDTKYHDNPKRREYRAELARERRKRNVMGNGGKDMSHAKNGKIVSEDASKNRARHFKSRGTLK